MERSMDKTGLIGRSIYDLDTPCLLLDLDILKANIRRAQEAADRAGLGLRPHIKAHKTPQVGLMQTRAGAIGVTAAKISEAYSFATAGIEDIFIANQLIGPTKMQRLLVLANRVPRLAVAVDSLVGASQLSAAFAGAGREVDVILEVDAGAGRCGVPAGRLVELADQVSALPGLHIKGLYAYAGGAAYATRDAEAIAKWAAEESAFLGEQARRLRSAGFPIDIISGGCTPSAPHYRPGCGLTEIRPGTYALNDRNQIDLNTCTEADVATTVLSTVISTPAPDRVVLDAGSKSLATQIGNVSNGWGWVLGEPEGVLFRLNDEHGYLDPRPMVRTPQTGDKLRLIPPRICTCLNLYDEVVAISGERVEDIWPIAARGANR
jgi:D-serine deaminase-like pyridoxal phosphate-dependent protein